MLPSPAPARYTRRDQVVCACPLTDIPMTAEVVCVSANKTSAQHKDDTRFTCKNAMRVSLRSITRGRARGPPTALSPQFGLGRRFLGNARFLAGRPAWSALRERRG